MYLCYVHTCFYSVFFFLPFQLVELFTPLYPIPHASRGNDDPSLPQRCCWKKNQTKYNYYCLAGCICNYSLVNMSFRELAHNHNDQCPAWVAAQAQGCCLPLRLSAAWAGARHREVQGEGMMTTGKHCSSWSTSTAVLVGVRL